VGEDSLEDEEDADRMLVEIEDDVEDIDGGDDEHDKK